MWEKGGYGAAAGGESGNLCQGRREIPIDFPFYGEEKGCL